MFAVPSILILRSLAAVSFFGLASFAVVSFFERERRAVLIASIFAFATATPILLASTGVPAALDGAFTEVDLSGLQLGNGAFYIGARWNPSIDRFFFVCADQSLQSETTDGWYIDDRADGWSSVLTTTDPIFANHRAMLIRPVVGEAFALAIPTMGNVGIFIFVGVLAVFAMLILRRRDEPQ